MLSWIGVLVWAIFAGGSTSTRWTFFASVSFLYLLGVVTKYAWPSKKLRDAGVPTRSVVVGALFGIVGFFVIPFVGLPLGFVAGVFVAELVRHSASDVAWRSAVRAF